MEAAEALFALLAERAQNHQERVEVQCVRTDLYTTTGRLSEALREALIGLSVCGIVVPESEQERQAMAQEELIAVSRNLGVRRIADLSDAPTQTDFDLNAEQKVLLTLVSPAYVLSPTLFSFAVLKSVNSALVHGNSERTASSYMFYALFLAGVLGRYDEAVEFGRAALKLNERFRSVELSCRLPFQFGSTIAHYRLPLRESIAYLEQAMVHGPESGDLMYFSYAAFLLPTQVYALGQPLTVIGQLVLRGLDVARRIHEKVALSALSCFTQVLRALGGETHRLDSLNDGQFDEAQHLAMLQEQKMGVSEYWYQLRKAQLAYLAGDFQAAYEFAAAAEHLLPSCVGLYYTTEAPFWRALALLAQGPGGAADLDDGLARDLKSLAAYAHNAPMNHLHKLRLVEAEQARVAADDARATALYHEALQLSESGGFTPDAALTHELWSRFRQSLGDVDGARTHKRCASQLYSQWGATAKAAQLEA